MARWFGLQHLLLCGFAMLTAGGPADAAELSVERADCDSFYPIPNARPGLKMYMSPRVMAAGSRGKRDYDVSVSGFFEDEAGLVGGVFFFPVERPIAIWSSYRDKLNIPVRFTVLRGEVIAFYPDGGISSIPVTSGLINEPVLDISAGVPPILCKLGEPKPEVAEPTLKDLLKRDSAREPEAKKPGTLGALMSEPKPSDSDKKTESPDKSLKKRFSKTPKRKTRTAAKDGPFDFCSAIDLEPTDAVEGGDLEPWQTVAMRNAETKVQGFDLIVSGDVIPLETTQDITDSAGKLVAYREVRANQSSTASPPPAWVSAPGLSKPAASPSGAVKKKSKERTAKPAARLRLVVVGGAEEIAVSGLDAVGGELDKLSGGTVAVDAEWYSVGEDGTISLAANFGSLEELVEGARKKEGAGRLAVLDEKKVMAFFDSLEATLVEKQAVDRVVWVKGAYAMPSGTPGRLEDLIEKVSGGETIARGADGGVGRWLLIVSARMPGFSIAYLKEPIYSRQIGDVIEEQDSSGKDGRRLIGNPGVVAARMRAAAAVKPKESPAEEPVADPNSPAGRLVYDANVVFAQRGQIFSEDAAMKLRRHLEQLLALWSSTRNWQDSIEKIARDRGKTQPSLVDLVQDVGSGAIVQLPRSLPEWSRKPLRELSESERKSAHALVTKFIDGANRLVEDIRSEDGARCKMLFVPDEFFGIGKT